MYIWKIRGGIPLVGSIRVQGAKNSVLPILAACILAPCETELINCPNLRDVQTSLRILRHLGCTAEQDGDTIYIDSRSMCRSAIPSELMHEMRSSVTFLGALLARCGHAAISDPGGCALGARPINIHVQALEALGAVFENADGGILCTAPDGLHGAVIELPYPSVGATENVMLAACAASGETVILNAAREPEIEDLQDYLQQLGANIYGAGSPIIHIRGFSPVKRTGYRIMPDRIAAATLQCAAAASGGDIEITGVEPRHLRQVTAALHAMGCEVSESGNAVRTRVCRALRGCSVIETGPYPAFPTDAQPLLLAASLRACGVSVFLENVFDDRFRYAQALKQLGANIRIEGRAAIVSGVPELYGTAVRSTDLRGGAAMVIAALGARGETEILDTGHIVRGYDSLDRQLGLLGADIEMSCDMC